MASEDQDYQCKVVINGNDYKDWESVTVTAAFPGQFRTFRVSVCEGISSSLQREKQIKPGDKAEVYLGGELCVTGWVYQRQAVMDANTHGVLIEGQGKPGDTVRTSIDIKALGNGGNFKGQSFRQIATKVLELQKLKAIFLGDHPEVFDKVIEPDAQVTPGESAFAFFERLVRFKKVFIGDDPEGNYVFYSGGSPKAQSGTTLVEGENIQSIRATVTDMYLVSPLLALVQAHGDDKTFSRPANQPMVLSKGSGDPNRPRPYIVFMERGLSPKTMRKDLQDRFDFEMAWRDGTKVQAEIVTPGWKKAGGKLWKPGIDQLVHVQAPSVMITEQLAVLEVTFTQSNEEGTLSRLTLVNPKQYFGPDVPLE